jgi:hypothetical protein
VARWSAGNLRVIPGNIRNRPGIKASEAYSHNERGLLT